MAHHGLSCLLAATVASALPVAAQREVRQISSAAEAHQQAVISPDGQLVAFLGPGKIGVVAFSGGTEGTLVSSPGLGDFVWSPLSSGIYFIDGTDLKFVRRSGGTATTLVALPGRQHRLWCVDSTDKTLFGTRLDPATATYHVFAVATNGGAPPTDIISSVLVMDDLRLDPTDSALLYRTYTASTPFAEKEYFRADPDGGNPTSLTGGAIQTLPEGADWVDDGQSIAFAMISPTSFVSNLARIGPSGTQITMLTEGSVQRRQSVVTPDRQWVVHYAPYAGGTAQGPAIVPADGGGAVELATDGLYYQPYGPPSAAGTRIVFAAAVYGSGDPPQVFGVELDRELRITPRAETGNTFHVDLPVAAGEQAAVFLSAGLGSQRFTLPGFAYGFVLDPAIVATVASGAPAAGSLGVDLFVPRNPALVGQSLFFQGLRVKNPTLGDFSRHAEVRIF